MQKVLLSDVEAQLRECFQSSDIPVCDSDAYLPSKDAVIELLGDLQALLFPRYMTMGGFIESSAKLTLAEKLERIRLLLQAQVREAFLFQAQRKNEKLDISSADERAGCVVGSFLKRLPEIYRVMLTDVQAFFDGDPAAKSKEEIICAYPGFLAIFVYRISHELYVSEVPLLPRIISEHAHGLTGVDINPGAQIDEYFFIDHATGVVIGETTTIGKHVKIYQGVTLGALSTRAGQQLAGVKRHPTIEDNVTIYANASILGGETVIGEGSVIAGSAFVTSSVPPHSRVSVKGIEINVRTPQASPSSWEL